VFSNYARDLLFRNLLVISQNNDLQRWKDKRKL
jgi:hypothetical protein